LEKDVRYLDSRIALLIQNRMALEEVRARPPILTPVLTVQSKMKLQAISKMLQIYKRVSFQMTRRLRNTATYSFSYNPNPDILHTFADWSRWPRSIPFSKLSCLPFTETNTKAVKNIYF
jgi:hypothetical protein